MAGAGVLRWIRGTGPGHCCRGVQTGVAVMMKEGMTMHRYRRKVLVAVSGLLLGSGVAVLVGIIWWLEGKPRSRPDEAVFVEPDEVEPPPRYCGWIPDPQAVQECLKGLEVRSIRSVPAWSEEDRSSDEEAVYLWEAVQRVTGQILPGRNQGAVGSCVAVATASALEHLQCVQIAAGEQAVYRDVASEVIYGGSRVQIGGGRIRGDGSVGVWAARWVKDYGVVPRGLHGRYDLRSYDEQRCRDLGRRGVPPELIAIARQHPVLEVMRVQSWAEARVALRRGYPVLVCSDQGFRLERDSEGFCAPRGIWYHAMALIGMRGGRRPGGFLLNSWGDEAHRGPRVPPHAPPAGFWVDAAILDRMLRQGDSWAFAHLVGFSERNGTTPAQADRLRQPQRLFQLWRGETYVRRGRAAGVESWLQVRSYPAGIAGRWRRRASPTNASVESVRRRHCLRCGGRAIATSNQLRPPSGRRARALMPEVPGR